MYTKKITNNIMVVKDKKSFNDLKDMFVKANLFNDKEPLLFSKEYFKIQDKYFDELKKILIVKKTKTNENVYENYNDIKKNYPAKFLSEIIKMFNKDSIYRVHGTTSKDAAASILKNVLNIYAENPCMDHTSLNIGYQDEKKLLETLLNYEHKGPLKHLMIVDAKDEHIILKENKQGKKFGNIPPKYIKGYIDIEHKKVHYNKEWQGECINAKAEQKENFFNEESLINKKPYDKNFFLRQRNLSSMQYLSDLEFYTYMQMSETLSDQYGFLHSLENNNIKESQAIDTLEKFKNKHEAFLDYMASSEYNEITNKLKEKSYVSKNHKSKSTQIHKGISLDNSSDFF